MTLIEEAIFYFKGQEDAFKDKVKELSYIMTDVTTHSLEERWKLFKTIQDYLPVGADVTEVDFLRKYQLDIDDFDYSRYERVDIRDLFDDLLVRLLPEEQKNSLKEDILSTGIGYFINDW
jgi:hypothetical protein